MEDLKFADSNERKPVEWNPVEWKLAELSEQTLAEWQPAESSEDPSSQWEVSAEIPGSGTCSLAAVRLRFVEQKVAKRKAVGQMVVERKAVQGQPVELAEPGEQKPGERRRT